MVPVSLSSKGLQLKAQAGEGDVGAEKAAGGSCQESQVPSTPPRPCMGLTPSLEPGQEKYPVFSAPAQHQPLPLSSHESWEMAALHTL